MSKKPESSDDEFDYQGKSKESYSSSAIIVFCSVIALIITLIIIIIENILSK